MDITRRCRDWARWHLEPLAIDALIKPRKDIASLDLGSALVPATLAESGGVTYSVGVGEDIEFEKSLAAVGSFEQWLFDPTPRSIEFMNSPRNRFPGISFRPIGVWSSNERMWFHAPKNPTHVSHSITEELGSGGFEADCRTISSIMSDLRHPAIDILKMNIEGAEDQVLASALHAGVKPRCIITTWEGRGALRKAIVWTRRLEKAGWSYCGRKGWFFTYMLR